MENTTEITILICEGPSEEQYCRELREWLQEQLRNEKNKWSIKVRTANGCGKALDATAREQYKNNRKNDIKIWKDADVIKRKEKGKYHHKDIIKRDKDHTCETLLNKYNFEDFLVLHLPKERVIEWQSICKVQKHFNIPMNKKEVNENIKKIFLKYKKGEMPRELNGGTIFKLNKETVKQLFQNNKDKEIEFSSGFATFLEEKLKEIECSLD